MLENPLTGPESEESLMDSDAPERHFSPRQEFIARQNLESANALWWFAKSLKKAVLRAEHPDWPAASVEAEFRRVYLPERDPWK